MQVTTIGLDIAKNVFQVHGIDANEKVVVRKQLHRRLWELQMRQAHPHFPEVWHYALLHLQHLWPPGCSRKRRALRDQAAGGAQGRATAGEDGKARSTQKKKCRIVRQYFPISASLAINPRSGRSSAPFRSVSSPLISFMFFVAYVGCKSGWLSAVNSACPAQHCFPASSSIRLA